MNLFNPLPRGVEIRDVDDIDDRIETAQLTAADTLEAAQSLDEHLKEIEHTSAAGVVFDMSRIFTLKLAASCILDNAKAAHIASMDVALARLEGLR